MSSIAAILCFGQPLSADRLQAISQAGACLGPDGATLWHSGSAGLAYGLFATTPEEGSEPLPREVVGGFASTTGLAADSASILALTADMRLDNRGELFSRLAEAGRQLPAAASDARLVLCGFRLWGEAVFAQLVGDFALALWDGPNRRLLCARDALGQRPLFYHLNQERFLAASSIRQLFTDSQTPRGLDERTVAGFLSAHSADEEATFFQEVRRLPAGQWLEVRHDGRCRRARHWHPLRIDLNDARGDDWYAEQFRERFLPAVEGRLRTGADRIGVHVSGGFDSTAIVAGAHQIASRSGRCPDFVAFSNLADRPEANERPYIDAVLARYPMPQQTTAAQDFWAFRPVELGSWRDEPYLPIYFAQLVQELQTARSLGIQVMLAGSGGDEIGGNSWYLIDLLLRGKLRQLLPELRGRAAARRATSRGLLLSLLRATAESWLRTCSGRQLRPAPWLARDFARRQHLPRRQRDQDRMGNLARQDTWERLQFCWSEPALTASRPIYSRLGVELRHPFFDRRLFEWALSIPPYKCGEAGMVKTPLRHALRELLPPAVANRADKGNYLFYWDLGIRHRERARIEELLKEPRAAELGFIDAPRLLQAYRRYCHGGPIHRRQLWNVLALETWLREP